MFCWIPPPISRFSGSLSQILTCWGFLEMTCKNIIRWFKQRNTLSHLFQESSFLMELSLQNFCSLLELGWAGLGFFFKVTAFLLQLLGEMLLRSPVQVWAAPATTESSKQSWSSRKIWFYCYFILYSTLPVLQLELASVTSRDDFCSLLELLVPVWAGASNHRIPAKRQIIFQIELSENSVENARKTADFGIELSENFNRWPGPTLLCLHSLVHGLSESKGFSFISCREKKWIGKESESENRAIPTEFARNSRVFFFSN